jgi:TonB family protein
MSSSSALQPDPEPVDPAPPSHEGHLVANMLGFRDVSSNFASQGIESSDLAIDLILHDIAERALQVTGASGAAIAIEREGALVCRAAAGSTAPDLGVKINVQSGLSGACVRERKLQWCSDTERDSRVDAEASRTLGVRSIIVVPLLVADKLVGVFEIFSSQPDAFRDRDVTALQEMVRWVQDAVGSERRAEQPEALFESAAEPARQPAEPVSNYVPIIQKSVQVLAKRDQSTRILRGIAIGLAVLLCVLLVYRWGRKAPSTSLQAAAVDRGTRTASVRETVRPGGMPDVGLTNVTPKPASGRRKGPASNAALILRDNTSSAGPQSTQLRKTSPADQGTDDATQAASRPTQAVNEQDQAQTPAAIPDKELAAAGPPPLRSMPGSLAAAVSPPSIKLPDPVVSKGVAEGRLIHSVRQKYPVAAILRRIEGLVILHAVIAKDGALRDLKSVRGDRLLLQAAVDAVRQWRYEPYKLNGVPVDMPIDITINFNLPK